ncbi:dipeptide epimerase [Parahaliea mediterranea]|uniref:dipeptide epimerase n=1 Tax=Parahaliea mediterranea TaxID=651086 RepID=UPI000E2F82ED|nr:dipeptide epimerase [Parahaliea mediterranea]
MQFTIDVKRLPLRIPFSITGYTFEHVDALQVSLTQDGVSGRGEGIGIYYLDETADSMRAQLESIRSDVEGGIDRTSLLERLPPGGARNALDCALWDLEAKRSGTAIWELLALQPRPLVTVATVGIGTPEQMAEAALRYAQYDKIKVKLSADEPIARLEAIRAARPDASILIDVNQGWSFDELREYAPAVARLNVDMIEQPLPRGGDDILEGYRSPVPLGADESCLSLAEYAKAARCYDVISIKLDKCGGLTEALQIVDNAQRDGKELMVGNMVGTSLSMAPAFVVGQHCRFVDIDGPLLLEGDIEHALDYATGGVVGLPSPQLWG